MARKQDERKQRPLANRLQALGALLSRAKLMARLGQQYDEDRDLYEALGYELTLKYDHYAAKYERQDIAAAIINKPVSATWRGGVEALEADDDEDTEFERAWKELYDRLGLHSKFVRLDKLACLGHYGVLLLGLSDVQSKDDWVRPVEQQPPRRAGGNGSLRLLYVKPYGEGSADIKEWESDPSSERYGLPKIYQIDVKRPGTDYAQQLRVHHTRVLHVVQGLLEDEAEGTPVLHTVFNRLMDIEKLAGGSAEMFWRGARPGYQGKVDPEYQMTDEVKEDLEDQLDEFEHNLRRMFMLEGVELKALAPQVADPANHLDVQLQMISAVTGIPKRILVGSERGELASTEDRGNWLDMISARREEYAEPVILRPFVQRCVDLGVLPAPGEAGYEWQWSDLYAPSEKERAEVGRTRSEALAAYTKVPLTQETVPPDAFLRLFLGLGHDDVAQIEAMREKMMSQEQAEVAEGTEEVGSSSGE